MLKHFAIASIVLGAVALPASAQDAREIARVQAGKNCQGCNLFQADLSYLELPGVNVSGSRLRQADLSLVTMNRANFAKANLSVANLFGARFANSNFAGANLEQATLVGAYFGGSNLSGANLSGANLSGAEMAEARGLKQSQLNKACGDETTQLPRGLTVPAC